MSAVKAGASLFQGHKQNEVSLLNARMHNREAEYQSQRTDAEESSHWRSVKKVLGQQATEFATSGISLSSGSVEDVYAESVREAEFDAAIIQAGGSIAANRSKFKADLAEEKGSAAFQAGSIKALTSVLAS